MKPVKPLKSRLDYFEESPMDESLIGAKCFKEISELTIKQNNDVKMREVIELMDKHSSHIWKHFHSEHDKGEDCCNTILFKDHSLIEMLFVDGYLAHIVAGSWASVAKERMVVTEDKTDVEKFNPHKPTIH
jgi:hypothetical protein